jgi:hypothetical protein
MTLKQLMVLAAFVILTAFTTGAAVAAEPLMAPALCVTTVAVELPAAITAPAETEQRMPSLDAIEAWSSRLEVATCAGSYEWRCHGSDCGGYGVGQRRCCVGGSCGSWQNTPICC